MNFEPLHGSSEMQDKTCKQQVSHEAVIIDVEIRIIKLITIVLIEITFGSPDLHCYILYMLNNLNISKKIYLVKHFIQKSGNSKYCNFHYGYLSANFTKCFTAVF